MRLNQLTGRWVTIVADRADRPTDFAPRGRQIESEPGRPCPFCPGSERATPPALEAVDEAGSWSIRIVPNLYPAFDGDDGFAVRHLGPVHVAAKASGIHEIFVFSPDHDGALHHLGDRQASDLMHALKRRFIEHATTRHVRYTQAIVNHGHEAGASLSHPHGQLLGLPFVPGEVLDEERAFARFVGGCVLCTTVEAEMSAEERIIFANDDVVVMCPYWSGSPYELLFVPRRHEQHLQDADADSLDAMGRALRDATAFLNEALGDIAYNVGFHTAPHQHGGEFHWHVHLWPNLHTIAGFERGTGVLINVVPPEQAAEVLRSVAALA